jgi:hypothetical protein
VSRLVVNVTWTDLVSLALIRQSCSQDIFHPSHHLLNVLLQIANKLGLSNKKKFNDYCLNNTCCFLCAFVCLHVFVSWSLCSCVLHSWLLGF